MGVVAAVADENGTGVWGPGQAASFAAAPLEPGWMLTNIFSFSSASSAGSVAVAREFTIGEFARTATVSLDARLHTRTEDVRVWTHNLIQ